MAAARATDMYILTFERRRRAYNRHERDIVYPACMAFMSQLMATRHEHILPTDAAKKNNDRSRNPFPLPSPSPGEGRGLGPRGARAAAKLPPTPLSLYKIYG